MKRNSKEQLKRLFEMGKTVVISKWCPKCKQSKPPEQFHKHRRAVDGLDTYCKQCKKGLRKKWPNGNGQNTLHKLVARRDKLKLKLVAIEKMIEGLGR